MCFKTQESLFRNVNAVAVPAMRRFSSLHESFDCFYIWVAHCTGIAPVPV